MEYIFWNSFEVFVSILAKKVQKNEYDSIICISTGGLVLGKMLSDQLSLPLSIISAKSYEKGHTKNGEVQIGGNISSLNKVEGKILLVDDLVDSGNTMKVVVDYLSLMKSITSIHTATLYKKSKSIFTPDFFVKESDEWIVFPYEKTEFNN
jgi:uncharacterized protein